MKFVVTIRGKRMNPSTIKRLALLWIDGVHKVRSPIVLRARGTSNGEKAINPSTFHMIFVILMIMILMC
ncbi:hypothetical protein Hanom_Chr16g01520661 [Helianthus anomalus]